MTLKSFREYCLNCDRVGRNAIQIGDYYCGIKIQENAAKNLAALGNNIIVFNPFRGASKNFEPPETCHFLLELTVDV